MQKGSYENEFEREEKSRDGLWLVIIDLNTKKITLWAKNLKVKEDEEPGTRAR